MARIQHWTTRVALLTFSLFLLNACSTKGQETTVLDTPEWNQFRALSLQYDSILVSFEKREKEDPAFAADPMGTAGEDVQKFYALMQKIGESIPASLGEIGDISDANMDDLRMIKLAAMMGEKRELLPKVDKAMLQYVKDADSLKGLKIEIAQFALMNGDIDEAKSFATDDVLEGSQAMNKAMLFSTFSKAYLDANKLSDARVYALKAVNVYGQVADEDAATTGADPRKAQWILSQYGALIAPLIYEFKEAGDAAGMDALLAETKALLPESTKWTDVQASISTAVAEISKERAALNQPAAVWAEHSWIGSKPLSLEALKGKVILVDFFATWCKPCIQAFTHLKDWHQKYEKDGLVIIGLTTYQGRYNGETVEADAEMKKLKEDFIPKHELTWPVGVEKNGRQTMTDYNVTGIPHVVLIDRAGKVQYVKVGATDYDKTEKKIQELLAE